MSYIPILSSINNMLELISKSQLFSQVSISPPLKTIDNHIFKSHFSVSFFCFFVVLCVVFEKSNPEGEDGDE
jgi:hypothetical protein